MAKDARTSADIISHAANMLLTARRGLADLQGGDPSRRLPGIHNAIVFGRAVTNVLENLRSRVSAFDEWYKPRTEELSQDVGLRRLYEMRSEILKQGRLDISNSVTIKYLNTADLQDLLQEPPPGARGFFIGDRNGGSGWEVELPTGELVPFYVQLPPTVKASFSFELQTKSGAQDIAALLDRYLEEMSRLVSEAQQRFEL